MQKIILKVEYRNHTEIVLTNKRGDTFSFDPHKYEEFSDFIGRSEKDVDVISQMKDLIKPKN